MKPQDAYDIVLTIFNQYGYSVEAPLLVRSILDGYNWTKVFEARHAQFLLESK